MLFVELRFFVFFAIVFGVYWMLKNNDIRKLWLLGTSFVFYGMWDWRFLALIMLITIISYIVGLKSSQESLPKKVRKRWLTFGITSSLIVLGVFKYFNFFVESFTSFANQLGVPVSDVTLSIVLPVGISFYTFQAISYAVDCYRKNISSQRKFTDVAFYIAFFPQLVAGPIVRASDFVPQIHIRHKWSDVAVKSALTLFLIGFIKKACISDNIAPYVDLVFADPSVYSASSIIAGVLLYGVQIYCDFSGYSDMAIALAALLGYNFPKNFDAPYLSSNIQDFWRRWHISLSSWLRDYLYIPLGGNRKGPMQRDINLMTTMVLGGLWHGASFNFIIWGFLHGLALILDRTIRAAFGQAFNVTEKVKQIIGMVVTFYWVNLAWIFFRAETLSDASNIAQTYLTLQANGTSQLPGFVWPLLASFAAIHFIGRKSELEARSEEAPNVAFAAAYGAIFAMAIAFVPVGYRPFIYFQF